MKLWIVKQVSICTGSRIEGFTVKEEFFTSHAKALDRAYELATKHHEQRQAEEEEEEEEAEEEAGDKGKALARDPKGSYSWEDRAYSCWDEYAVTVQGVALELDKDIVLTTRTGM
jgi:hypothetical protein